MMSLRGGALAGSVLILAGLYQFTPLKHACLRQCQAPVAFLSLHWQPGARGAWAMGLRHGAFCLGCCWALMALLFVGGVMNLYWIAGLALLVAVEKLALFGRATAAVTGVVLTAAGVKSCGQPNPEPDENLLRLHSYVRGTQPGFWAIALTKRMAP